MRLFSNYSSEGAVKLWKIIKHSKNLVKNEEKPCTICDLHDFGLTWKCQKMCLGGCTITLKTKINVFWNFFFTPLTPWAPLRLRFFQKTLILSFEANSACPVKMRPKLWKSHIVHPNIRFWVPNPSYHYYGKYMHM